VSGHAILLQNHPYFGLGMRRLIDDNVLVAQGAHENNIAHGTLVFALTLSLLLSEYKPSKHSEVTQAASTFYADWH
jgi:hypothetical protein